MPCHETGAAMGQEQAAGGNDPGAPSRIYLVIVDDSPESARAMRFAARRALRTGAAVHILALVPRAEIVPFGSVQATMEAEACDRAEALAQEAACTLSGDTGLHATIAVKSGDGPQAVRQYLRDHPEVSALVIGAAAGPNPGPLASHFAAQAGNLPCVLMIVPGGADEARIDAVS